jgi:hypothetical protein
MRTKLRNDNMRAKSKGTQSENQKRKSPETSQTNPQITLEHRFPHRAARQEEETIAFLRAHL